MNILVPSPQIHQQSPQRPPALSGSNNAREPTIWNNFPAAAVPPTVPRHQQFAEGSEYYTWVSEINIPICRALTLNEPLLIYNRPPGQLTNNIMHRMAVFIIPQQPQYRFQIQ